MTDENKDSAKTSGLPAKPHSGAWGGIFAFALIVSLWGCLLIYSSRLLTCSPTYFVVRQAVWLFAGLCVMYCAGKIPFSWYVRYDKKIMVYCVMALVAVLAIGTKINGTRGWFQLTEKIFVQPSEFVKTFLLLHLAVLYGEKGSAATFKDVLKGGGGVLLLALLVLIEPDGGMGILYFGTFVITLFAAKVKMKYVLFVITSALVAIGIFTLVNPYAAGRFCGLMDPYGNARSAWHVRQFIYAMAEGGLTGSEQGLALWSNTYMPLSHTDSMFSTIMELSGLAGGALVIAGFIGTAAIFARMASKRGLTKTASLFIFSSGALYAFQALIHASVNTALLPPTGLPLPALSYGGSSLVSLLTCFGMVISALRSVEDTGRQVSDDAV